MLTYTKNQHEKITKLNCRPRWVRKNFAGDPEKSGLYCEILDNDSDSDLPYAQAMGDTDSEALDKALNAAYRAPKPMTRAQVAEREADPDLAAMLDEARRKYFESKGDPAPEAAQESEEAEKPTIPGWKRKPATPPQR